MIIERLGQGGLFITLNSGKRIIIDPYLSNSLYELKDSRFTRLVPTKTDIPKPDLIMISHDHIDHYDIKTLHNWLDDDGSIQILTTYPVYQSIVSKWPTKHNIVVMRDGVEVTMDDMLVQAVPASHESNEATGFLISAEGKNIYVSGDTLYTTRIIDSLKAVEIDVAFLCINGFGNNMNYKDAARMANLLKPHLVIPVHWDMFEAFGENPELFIKELVGVQAQVVRAYEQIEI